MSILKTTRVNSVEDVRKFFDAFSHHNVEQHGKAKALLDYRIRLLKKYAGFLLSDDVLDIGCGNGHHLYALDGSFRSGYGVDIAPGMVDAAYRHAPDGLKSRYSFQVDDAQTLESIPDGSMDVVLCIGALEHMFNKQAVIEAAYRVMKPAGRFVCLTLNDQFLWYRTLAPLMGYATQHLTTDQRLDKQEATLLMQNAGFRDINIDFWTFIPRGDMPRFYAGVCRVLDWTGHLIAPQFLRGGIVMAGVKPE